MNVYVIYPQVPDYRLMWYWLSWWLFLFLELYAVFLILELPSSFTVTPYWSYGRDNFTIKGKYKDCFFPCNICIQSSTRDYICVKCLQWNTGDKFCWLNDYDSLFIYCPKCIDAACQKKIIWYIENLNNVIAVTCWMLKRLKCWLFYCKTIWPSDVPQM